MRTKQEVQTRRMAALGGIVGGLFLFTFFRTSFGRINQGEPFRSFFFTHAENWPEFVKSFAPLDLVLACAYLWVVMHLALSYNATSNVRDAKAWMKLMLGYYVAFGSIGGVFGAIMSGWYSSFEFFFVMGAGMIAIIAFILMLLSCVLVVGPIMGRFLQSVWFRLRTKPVARPLVRFGRYINADGVPEAPEDA